MTRNKTNLLCARGYKNRPKRKETSKFIAGNESWFYGYDPGTKEESSSCHSRELRQMKSGFKSMLSVFLNSEVIFQKEFFSSVPAC
jgi:hypothetical protein